jgi:hypothetical protein
MRVQEEAIAIGTLRSNESVVVRPEISGRISAIDFVEGSAVRKGQLLVDSLAGIEGIDVLTSISRRIEAGIVITKHGILIVEFANQLQRNGLAVREAVGESAVLRLRPILMTTGAMVLGAIPLALAHGAGAESRQPIGWVIVGGLLVGTALTLFVVPTVYSLVARRHRPIGEAEAPAPGTAAARHA